MRGRRKRGDSKRVEYTYDDRYLGAYLEVWRRQKAQELVNMRAGIRLLKEIIRKYENGEVTRGLFGSPQTHEPTTNRIQHPGPRSPAG